MVLHLIKMAVGVEDVAHLAALQRRRLRSDADAGESPVLNHRTRHAPKRAAEILAGGSMYWIIKGRIRARQRILAVERKLDGEGRAYCDLGLDPALIRTQLQQRRPQQGWRYLDAKDAPPDFDDGGEGLADMPAEMVAKLRDLGLI